MVKRKMINIRLSEVDCQRIYQCLQFMQSIMMSSHCLHNEAFTRGELKYTIRHFREVWSQALVDAKKGGGK